MESSESLESHGKDPQRKDGDMLSWAVLDVTKHHAIVWMIQSQNLQGVHSFSCGRITHPTPRRRNERETPHPNASTSIVSSLRTRIHLHRVLIVDVGLLQIRKGPQCLRFTSTNKMKDAVGSLDDSAHTCQHCLAVIT